MARVDDPDAPCKNCPHTVDEHQPVCVGTVVKQGREQYCGCPGFELAEFNLLGYV